MKLWRCATSKGNTQRSTKNSVLYSELKPAYELGERVDSHNYTASDAEYVRESRAILWAYKIGLHLLELADRGSLNDVQTGLEQPVRLRTLFAIKIASLSVAYELDQLRADQRNPNYFAGQEFTEGLDKVFEDLDQLFSKVFAGHMTTSEWATIRENILVTQERCADITLAEDLEIARFDLQASCNHELSRQV